MFRSLILALLFSLPATAGPGRGVVVAQEGLAAEAGAQVLREGGSATDASIATAFALAVTHPIAGNLGGGGFLLLRSAEGRAEFLDFREQAPASAHPRMFLKAGRYDAALHHGSLLSVGVPGTPAGLHAAWKRHGRLPWRRLLDPAIRLAEEGFPVSPTLAESLGEFLPDFRPHPPTLAQFSRGGEPLRPGELLRQPELAGTLRRLAKSGPADFYHGETARLLVEEMRGQGGAITARDLGAYRVRWRKPLRGSYRGVEVITAPPPSGGGLALLTMLNILEGYDLKALGPRSPALVHLEAEAMRRAFADRAEWIGDPGYVSIPLGRLSSKAYADRLRRSIRTDRASVSDPASHAWSSESEETTHISVVDRQGNAASLTFTLEDNYGVKRIVPGAGFLLNNEMGDFNAGPGLTDATGLVGTRPNLARPGKRMLSSMAPTLLVKQGGLFLVTGSPGGRTIPNTVLEILLSVVDFGMGAQEAVDEPRFHHQWLPDRLDLEKGRWPGATLKVLEGLGHRLGTRGRQGVAQLILVQDGSATGAPDRGRWAESRAAVE